MSDISGLIAGLVRHKKNKTDGKGAFHPEAWAQVYLGISLSLGPSVGA